MDKKKETRLYSVQNVEKSTAADVRVGLLWEDMNVQVVKHQDTGGLEQLTHPLKLSKANFNKAIMHQ